MDFKERIFLVAGSSYLKRQHAVAAIKKQLCRACGLESNVACFTFYAKELDLKELSEKIFTVSFEKNKLVIFKDAAHLSKEGQDFFSANLAKIIDAGNYLIWEIEQEYWQLTRDAKFAPDRFFGMLMKQATIVRAEGFGPEASVEDFKRGLRGKDLGAAVYAADKLFSADPDDRSLGQFLLGMIVSEAGFINDKIEQERWHSLLWEADRQIKEQGLPGRLVIERLLVRLFSGQPVL